MEKLSLSTRVLHLVNHHPFDKEPANKALFEFLVMKSEPVFYGGRLITLQDDEFTLESMPMMLLLRDKFPAEYSSDKIFSPNFGFILARKNKSLELISGFALFDLTKIAPENQEKIDQLQQRISLESNKVNLFVHDVVTGSEYPQERQIGQQLLLSEALKGLIPYPVVNELMPLDRGFLPIKSIVLNSASRIDWQNSDFLKPFEN